jgi:protein ImuA
LTHHPESIKNKKRTSESYKVAMAEPCPTLPALRQLLTPWHHDGVRRLALGAPGIDQALGGGLLMGAVHELHASRPLDHGATAGFAGALAVLAREAGKQTLWIQQDFAATEAGALYAMEAFGLPLSSLVIVQVPRVVDALWAFEEALKCRAVAAVIAEIAEDGTVDLTATRRLSLAARDGGGLGLFLRHRRSATSSASATRWEVASAASQRDQFGGLGHTTFALSLVKNRCGPCDRWTIAWDPHERAFIVPALSRGVAQTARDRSARALSARAA